MQPLLTGQTERGGDDAMYEEQLGSVLNSVSTLKDNVNYDIQLAESSIDTDYDAVHNLGSAHDVGAYVKTANNQKSEESTLGTRERDRILDGKNITQDGFLQSQTDSAAVSTNPQNQTRTTRFIFEDNNIASSIKEASIR